MAAVVVSGFGPWGSIDENPTALVLRRLAEANLPDLATIALPVDSAALPSLVDAVLHQHRPRIWIGLGLALGAAVIAVERVGVNLRDFNEPDIAGARPLAAPVVPGGPAAYLATVPAEQTVTGLRGRDIPARVSHSAGTFLCNQLFYTLLHAGATQGTPVRAGFLHMPAHPALVARGAGRTADQPSMAIETLVEAVRIAVTVARAE